MKHFTDTNRKIVTIKQTSLWILVVVLMFGFVYIRSLTFVFVDGDDATSIAYHLLGRNPDLQSPYSTYQGMMDTVLSLIPSDPILLKYIPLGITSLSTVVTAILMLALAFECGKYESRSNAFFIWIAIAVLLSIPEIFYFGLVYLPTMVAMCLVLIAHWLMKWGNNPTIESNRRIISTVLSLVIFGFGTAFRWNVGTYAAVIVMDIWINLFRWETSLSRRFLIGLGWGILAVVTSLLMIKFSGYGYSGFVDSLQTIQRVMNQAGTLTSTNEAGLGEILLRFSLSVSSELTPAFMLFASLGFILLVQKRDPSWMVVLMGLLICLPWLKSGGTKYLIVSLPGLIYCYVVGLTFIWEYISRNRLRKVQYLAVVLLIVLPWIIGVRTTREGSAWGPAFELRPYSDNLAADPKVEFVFGSGTAFPVPGGYRALYGHGYVLWGGEWRNLVTKMDLERQNAVHSALSLDLPLVATSWSPDYYLYYLYAMGFKTTDSADRLSDNIFMSERRFFNSDGRQFNILYMEAEGDDVFDAIEYLNSLRGYYSRVVLVGYPKSMRALYQRMPNALTRTGATSAILDLNLASDAIELQVSPDVIVASRD